MCVRVTPEVCKANPDVLFVFGDNCEGWGKKGQSIIRNEPNTIGIPTKKSPYVYMSDEEFEDNKKVLQASFMQIEESAPHYEEVFFIPNIGLGNADLQNRAPKTYDLLIKYIRIFMLANPHGGWQ
jgi:hypothetical protein|tara:strand:+ start:449 stop:823 length:375 start_codon:yes stop_codon:yes gene_type:complete